jgi:hypothetical protein
LTILAGDSVVVFRDAQLPAVPLAAGGLDTSVVARLFRSNKLRNRSTESLHGDRAVPFATPFGTSLDNAEQVGWGIVFHDETPQEVRFTLGGAPAGDVVQY